MVLVDFNAPRSQPHGEEFFEFRGVKLPVDHFIDHGTDLQPLRHDTCLAYPVGGVSFFTTRYQLFKSRERNLVQFRGISPQYLLSVVRVDTVEAFGQSLSGLRPS